MAYVLFIVASTGKSVRIKQKRGKRPKIFQSLLLLALRTTELISREFKTIEKKHEAIYRCIPGCPDLQSDALVPNIWKQKIQQNECARTDGANLYTSITATVL